MSTQSEARKLLAQLDDMLTATDRNIPASHLMFLIRVYLAGDGGTSHEEMQKWGFGASVASRLMQDFTKVRYDKRTPGYDMISVELDPSNFRRKIVRINQRGQKIMDRILNR